MWANSVTHRKVILISLFKSYTTFKLSLTVYSLSYLSFGKSTLSVRVYNLLYSLSTYAIKSYKNAFIFILTWAGRHMLQLNWNWFISMESPGFSHAFHFLHVCGNYIHTYVSRSSYIVWHAATRFLCCHIFFCLWFFTLFRCRFPFVSLRTQYSFFFCISCVSQRDLCLVNAQFGHKVFEVTVARI